MFSISFKLEERRLWPRRNPEQLRGNGVIHINLEESAIHRIMFVQLLDAGIIVAPNLKYTSAFQLLRMFDDSHGHQDDLPDFKVKVLFRFIFATKKNYTVKIA